MRSLTISCVASSSTKCRCADVIARGHAPETVKKIERLLYLAEYKRRQAAPGVKISARNFGRDRRYPITNRFREDIATEVSALGKTKAAALSSTSRKGED